MCIKGLLLLYYMYLWYFNISLQVFQAFSVFFWGGGGGAQSFVERPFPLRLCLLGARDDLRRWFGMISDEARAAVRPAGEHGHAPTTRTSPPLHNHRPNRVLWRHRRTKRWERQGRSSLCRSGPVAAGFSPMITSMKSTHESDLFRQSVVRLYSSFMLNIVEAVLTWGNNQKQWPSATNSWTFSVYWGSLIVEYHGRSTDTMCAAWRQCMEYYFYCLYRYISILEIYLHTAVTRVRCWD